MNYIGLVGMGLLVLAFFFFAIKREKPFLALDLISTLLLFIYSIQTKDVIFIVTNGLIIVFLLTRVKDTFLPESTEA